jgi:tetratricopeptide (TPR) repeat protein
MSRTYVALEGALGRQVVIKVLSPELLAGLSVERFRREILLAAQLQHPHIVPVLAAGDMGGIPWFTMPFVEGESLRQRLAQGPLTTGEVISVLRDVARALSYAHARGIVHRDIKPDNVLLSAGSATVTDFGIAKAINAARSGDGSVGATLTQVGTSIGTPTYMAPEQAMGDTNTDHRADLYAFGAMAWELLAGRPPFVADSPSKMVAAHLAEAPKDVREFRPDTPALLADLVMRCLAKDPAHRPAQAAEVARILETITSSSSTATAPAVLQGGRIRLGQAIGLWALATALVSLTAWAATTVIGLPDWVLPGSVGVMMAGLPIILFTWYVQRTAHRTFTATPQRTGGGSLAPQGTMATIALKASPHFSWRRAWLGGAIAVGAFAVLVLGFMVTRAMGIGPAASLKSRGALGEREVLVVADFRAPANDADLGPTVAEALRTDLGQSKAFDVLSRATLRELLGLMQRSQETVVQYELAREIATREGAKAVLDGEVTRVGQGYVIAARLVSAVDGSELAQFRQEAAGEDELLPSLGKLSRSVRERAGESLKSIRATSELERVTTSSLPALRKYVEGLRVQTDEGDMVRGMALLEEAVQLDSTFAMAWRRIAASLSSEGREQDKRLRAIATAYRHRERLTEQERLFTEATYFHFGPAPDLDKALAAYEQVIEIDSTNRGALNNAGNVLNLRNQWEKAESLYRKVTVLPRTFAGSFGNLSRAQIRNGRSAATLDSTVALFRKRFPTSPDIWETEWYAAWAADDLKRADSIALVTWSTGKTVRQLRNAAFRLGGTAAIHGRFRESSQWYTRSSEVLLKVQDNAAGRLRLSVDTAWEAGVRRDAGAARAALDRGFARAPLAEVPPTERPWVEVSQIAVMIQDPPMARRALEGFNKDLTTLSFDVDGRRAWFESQVALTEKRWDEAIALMHKAKKAHQVEENAAYSAIGWAHDESGRADSALAYYERYLEARDPDPDVDAEWLPRVHRRMGEVYESRGEADKAIEHYARFVNLWRNAEPEQQPVVREVTQRLERLRSKRG